VLLLSPLSFLFLLLFVPPSPPPPLLLAKRKKMMMVGQGSSFTIRQHPFTETQLKELELQTLIFNYLASGIPIPPHLIAHLRRSFYFLDQYPSSESEKSLLFALFSVFYLLKMSCLLFVCSEYWEESRGSRAMEVQENRWEEVEVFKRGIPGVKVL